MSDSVEAAIQQAAASATATGLATPIVIREDRSIVVPTALQQIAVQCDNEANVLHFECPRNWADIDLAAAVLYINVVKPDKSIVAFACTNVAFSEDTVTFDWVITEHITEVAGKLSFLVCARDPSDPGDGYGYRWHSNLCNSLFIAPGIVCTVPSDTPDPPHIPLYGTDTTLTEPGVPADAAVVGKALSLLSEDISNTGISAATATENQVPTADGKGGWSWKDQQGNGSGANYSMTTISSGIYTPTSDADTATSVTADINLADATFEKIRGYKALMIQFTSASALNSTGNVILRFVNSASNTTNVVTIAEYRYNLKSHRAMLLFSDQEHCAAMVFAQSSAGDLSKKTYATTKDATNIASVGVADFSGLSSAHWLRLSVANATVGNPINYQVVGISEEAANFT